MALQGPPSCLTTVKAAATVPSALAPSQGVPLGLRPSSDRNNLPSAYFSPSIHLLRRSTPSLRLATAPRISMRVASKQTYICRDCGYIYSDRTPFEKLADSYFCPVCGAPKRRFRAYEPAVDKNANATDVRKARKAQLKRDEAIGQALPIGIAVGIVLLAGLYFYLNNAY